MSARRGAAAVAFVLACTALIALLYRVFVTTAHGQLVDEASRDGGRTGSHVVVAETARLVLEVVSGATLGLATLVVVGIALVQRRVRQALAAAVVLVGATATTQLLKHVLLARPDLSLAGGSWPTSNSLPSGHTTFAASVSAALLLAVPTRLRPAAAVAGAAWTAVTGAATLALHWHRTSDVVAAVLVVGAWTALAAFLAPSPSRLAAPPLDAPPHDAPPRRRRGALARRAALLVLAAGTALGAVVGIPALVAVWVATPPGLHGALGLRVAFVGGAFAAGATCCAVMAAQLLLVSGMTWRPRAGRRGERPGALRAQRTGSVA